MPPKGQNQAQEAPKNHPELLRNPLGPRRTTGGPRKPQKAPGGPRRPQEAQGCSRRPQKAPESPRRLQEAPGGPRKLQEEALEAPGATNSLHASPTPRWIADPLRGDPLFVVVGRRGLLSDPLPGHKWRYRSPLLFLNIIIRHLTPAPSLTSLGPQNRDFRLGFSTKRRPVPPPDVIDATP